MARITQPHFGGFMSRTGSTRRIHSGVWTSIIFGIHSEQGAYASGTGDEHRHSLGAREFGEWNSWDWNAEASPASGQLRKRFHPRLDGQHWIPDTHGTPCGSQGSV